LTGTYLIVRGNGRKTPYFLIEGSVTLTSALVFVALFTMRGKTVDLFPLFSDLEIGFHIDGLGLGFAGLVAFLWPFAILYAIEYMEDDHRQDGFFGFYVLTYGITLGIAYAKNLPTLYFFYEMLTMVTFPLVLHYRDRSSRSAAREYLYYSMGGAAFAFIGLVFTIIYGSTTDFTLGGVFDLASLGDKKSLLLVVLVMAFFGFGIKAAVFPFHKWLPEASVAPTPVTALLHAVAVVKAGAFAITRLVYYIYGPEFLRSSWVYYILYAFVLMTIAYGSTMAVREIHFKRRLAYSTIANLSYIVLGIIMLSGEGMKAGILHLFIHALMKITAFYCAGAVMEKAHRHYVYELDGLGRKMPVTFVCFTIAGCSLMGVPLFGGFVSKWFLAEAMVQNGSWMGILGIVVLLYSAAMTAIYMMTVTVRAFFPPKGFDYSTLEGIHD
ncbi:MAG: hypothetical protein KBS81_00140, partial [Spirochaetales bacterium]|nr:hypothetical protein [Candidatus Physcosoma equi]